METVPPCCNNKCYLLPFVPVQDCLPCPCFRWLRKDGPRAIAKMHWLSQPFDQRPGKPWRYGTPKVLQQRVRTPWYPLLQGDPGHRQEQPLPRHLAMASDCHRV
jgi:hypothetical protein